MGPGVAKGIELIPYSTLLFSQILTIVFLCVILFAEVKKIMVIRKRERERKLVWK